MELGLTIPLMKQLGTGPLPYGREPDLRWCWDLHGIRLHGRPSLLGVHCETRYTLVLFDLCPGDWARLPQTFVAGLTESLRGAGFAKAHIQGYLERAGEPCLTKAHGRREVAFLNRAWEDVMRLDSSIDRGQQGQLLLEDSLNRLPRRCAGEDGLGAPLVRLRRRLEEEFA